jgi:large subunit ribosomal protein L9
MNVILQADVPHLGSTGDVVRVKDGYARNYLVPRGLAIVADERNVRQLAHFKRIADARAAKLLKEV